MRLCGEHANDIPLMRFLLGFSRASHKALLSLYVAAFFAIGHLQAQSSLNSVGSNALSSAGQVSFSIGQVFSQPQTSPGGSISPGVQQAVVITNSGLAALHEGSIQLYPNPTAGYLELRFSELVEVQHWLVLLDAEGKMLRKIRIDQKFTQLDLGDLPSASYTACVYNEQQNALQTFKIVKLN